MGRATTFAIGLLLYAVAILAHATTMVAYMPWARSVATGAIPRFLFGGVLLFCAKPVSRVVARCLE
jgi:hypothetical protein